jgi:TonB family protein
MSEAWKQYEGQVVDGKFHLRQYLGGSDHSTVFLTEIAAQVALKAAIKFIPAGLESSKTQIAQWQLTAKLSHPHLIQIFDAGLCHLGGRDLLYVVTEFAEENLAQILPHRALTSGEVQDMLPPVLEVLSYIHNQGSAHAHLKPGNVMAVQDQLKISSDGLLKNGEPGKAEPGLYNAPEIATGVTPASDVWSLGMTLVEVLTQRPLLWDGRGEPVVPETVPPPFRNIASHCLRQDPERRWTVAEIATCLQTPTNGAPKTIVSGSATNRPLAKSRYIGPIVAVAVLLVVIVGGRKLLSPHSETQQHPSNAATVPVAPSSTDAGDQGKAAAPAIATPAPAPRHSQKPVKFPVSDSVHGSVIQQALPQVSAGARHTIQGRIKVRVRVDVDSSGNVVAAKFESSGPSTYFANKSLEAARNWKFSAPQVNGQAAASVWVLKFAIGRTSTAVQSNQTKP